MKSIALQFYLKKIKPYSDKLPYFREVARIIWSVFWKTNLRLKSFWFSVDLEKIYWINPQKIENSLDENCQNFPKNSTYIGNGKKNVHNWDFPTNLMKFQEREAYKGHYQHFIEGREWSETMFYQSILRQMENGMVRWGCSSESEFMLRCRQLDELYKDIKKNGFKTQKMLGKGETLKHRRIREVKDEINVAIDRDGSLIHCDGQNRLAIAKILKIKHVPVKIYHRHKDWLKFRKDILTYIKKELNGKAYQPLLHPDLSDIPSVWSDQRFEIIRQNLSIKKGTLLNVGAHWGYFCHRFEELGYQCTAIEDSTSNLYFMEKLKRAERLNFNIINETVVDYGDTGNKFDFDIVLVLDVFSKFGDMGEEQIYIELRKIFKKIKASEIYFQVPEIGCMEKSQKDNKYFNHLFSSRELIETMIKITHLTSAEKIGEERNHGIYKFS